MDGERTVTAAANVRALSHAIRDYTGAPGKSRTVLDGAPELDALWWAADGLEKLAMSGVVPATAVELTLARMAEALDLIEEEA
jgi:hypothetical protein